MQSATYPSEYGFGVTQINVTTKSGTNQIHGSLSSTTAMRPSTPRTSSTARPIPSRRSSGTSTAARSGGPVLRNKLFFFANYEGLREDKALTARSSVPLAALRAGNFAGRNVIYDPATRVQQPDGTITAQPFPNNQIPANRIDAKAQTAMQLYWPEANLPGTASNYLNTEPQADEHRPMAGARGHGAVGRDVLVPGRFSWAKDRGTRRRPSPDWERLPTPGPIRSPRAIPG